MASERKYFIADKYIPHILEILKDTGHSIDNFGNQSAIFFNNVMNGFIEPSGVVQIETTYENVLSELTKYEDLSKKALSEEGE